MDEPDPRERTRADLDGLRAEADDLLDRSRQESLREVVRQALRDVNEGAAWMDNWKEIGEAGALQLANIAVVAARSRLRYVRTLLETYGPGLMFSR